MNALPLVLCTLAIGLGVAACVAPPEDAVATATPPLFESFGTLQRDIGTPVPAAQRYFDQGLRLAYGFNHEAAGRAFAEAARLDPSCAMCVWGQALVLGPNINLPMDAALAPEATRLARRAKALSGSARPADHALIDALVARYADPAPADRAPLDVAYADAMADAARRFPDDDDIATLHAESMMDLAPWSYWSRDGQPTGRTPQIVAALEGVLARNPRDVPFCLIYRCGDPDFELLAATGVNAQSRPAAHWPLAAVAGNGEPQTVALASLGLALPGGPWPDLAAWARILPLRWTADGSVSGVMVLGVSARRPLDSAYRDFLDLDGAGTYWTAPAAR
mgnify:CR=1 FL=1